MKKNQLLIRKLGIVDYQKTFGEMQEFTKNRNIDTCDEIWLLEHQHVFTQGKAGKPEHVLNPGSVPIVQTDRGGQITYHGPGQLIIYPLIDLRRANLGVKQFVNLLEDAVIETLAAYNINTMRRDDAPGIYLKDCGAKICSLGLRISRGCSYHGLALNITTDLSYFKRINPCGFKNLQMAKMSDFIAEDAINYAKLMEKVVAFIAKKFGHTEIINAEKSTSISDNTNIANITNIKKLADITENTDRKPPWIRSKLLSPAEITKTKKNLQHHHLVTVCDEAACPNKGECFGRGTATFMIMGDTCTRDCKFCNVTCGRPNALDHFEPSRLTASVLEMQLKYVVLTSVCRDDLQDHGATHFANCIQSLRTANPNLKIEILVPDFRGCQEEALATLGKNLPNVFAHNIETVPRLYPSITPSSDYKTSLQLLLRHKQLFPQIPTKSGIMVGLGETDEEIIAVLHDLRAYEVDMLTIGQYLRPSINNAKVERYVTPEKFQEFAKLARTMGFSYVASGPMVRSSYYAEIQGEMQRCSKDEQR